MFTSVKSGVASAILTVVTLLAIGTVVYHYGENWSWIDSFYFTVVLMTTVGLGDLHPTTEGMRLFTAIFLLAGVGAVVAALGVIGGRYLEIRQDRIDKRRGRREQSDE